MKTQTQFTAWNTASRYLAENIVTAIEGIEKYNYQMIIKYCQNEEHANPLKKINKDLDNPFNWVCISQFHRSEEEIKKALCRALNDTERDLLLNWTWIFGEPKAIKIYQETGKCTAGLFKGIGTCSQVRIKDMIQYFKENGKAERAKLWEESKYFNSGLWTPAKNINTYLPEIGNTYAVYYNNNAEKLPIQELHEILDNSIKAIIVNK